MSDPQHDRAWSGLPRAWHTPLVCLTVLLCLAALLFAETAASMAATWQRSETFAHGWLILPISLWLIWERRASLAARVPVPFPAALPLAAALGLGWLLGEVTGTLIVQQYAFVALLVCTTVGVLGLPVARIIAFPLAFLFFAVPFGEGLIPPLMDFTAHFSVALLRATGIPVFQEGTFISLPSGDWSVVEGCSGVRYLIATVTLGCLYAFLTYRSPWRRALFLLASVIVPIVANGLRAYMIMLIGHLSDMQLAGGVDHLLYGWVFFGIVIFLMFAIGAHWREPPEPIAPPAALDLQDTLPRIRPAAWPVSMGYALILLAFPAWAWVSRPDLVLPALELPDRLADRERAPARAVTAWEAETHGADQRVTAVYVQPGADALAPGLASPANAHAATANAHAATANAHAATGTPAAADWVHVEVTCYAASRQDAELLNSQNRLVRQKHPDWQLLPGATRATGLARPASVRSAEVRSRHPGGERLLVWDWWWLGGEHFTHPHYGKLREGLLRLTGHDTRGCWLIAATPTGPTDAAAEQRLATVAAALAVWQDAR